jgi:hypothetical protein
MKLIGIEENYLTADVRDAWDAIGLAATDPSVAFHSGEIERRLLDLAGERTAFMDETGLDVQVLSLTTPACTISGREASTWHAVPTMPWRKPSFDGPSASRHSPRCR